MDEQVSQPNILFITDDQHRWDFFEGLVPSLRTPNLELLKMYILFFSQLYHLPLRQFFMAT